MEKALGSWKPRLVNELMQVRRCRQHYRLQPRLAVLCDLCVAKRPVPGIRSTSGRSHMQGNWLQRHAAPQNRPGGALQKDFHSQRLPRVSSTQRCLARARPVVNCATTGFCVVFHNRFLCCFPQLLTAAVKRSPIPHSPVLLQLHRTRQIPRRAVQGSHREGCCPLLLPERSMLLVVMPNVCRMLMTLRGRCLQMPRSMLW